MALSNYETKEKPGQTFSGMPTSSAPPKIDELSQRYRDEGRAIVQKRLEGYRHPDIYTQEMTDDDYIAIGKKGAKKREKRTVGGTLKDIAITGAKGVVGAGEAAVGLADIPTLGRVGKAMEDYLGYDPEATHEFLGKYYSPAQKAAFKKVEEAKGFVPTAKEMLLHPSTIGHAVVESAPSMLGGAAAARKLIASGMLKMSPVWQRIIGAAIGEGLVGAGAAAEGIRQQTKDGVLTLKQSAVSALSGAGTAMFAVVGGRVAKKFGLVDPDTFLAGGSNVTTKGVVKRIIGGGISEGAFEELPQSMQEQVWLNAALDKPLLEGVGEAGATGLLTGAAMGAGFNIFTGRPIDEPVPPLGEEAVSEIATEEIQLFKDIIESGQLAQDIESGEVIFDELAPVLEKIATQDPALATQITEMFAAKEVGEEVKPVEKPISAARDTLLDEGEKDITAKELLTGKALTPEEKIRETAKVFEEAPRKPAEISAEVFEKKPTEEERIKAKAEIEPDINKFLMRGYKPEKIPVPAEVDKEGKGLKTTPDQKRLLKGMTVEEAQTAATQWNDLIKPGMQEVERKARIVEAETLVKERPDLFNLVHGKLTVEPVEKVKEKAQIPIFKDTGEAVEFGKKATPEQITEMKRLRKEAESRYHALTKEGKFDEAGEEAVQAQFYREAFEAKEKPAKPLTPKPPKPTPPKAVRKEIKAKPIPEVGPKPKKEPKVEVPVEKEPWEMTRAEYAGKKPPEFTEEMNRYQTKYQQHEWAVEEAIEAGKKLPPEVLKDYPDLVEKPIEPKKKIEAAPIEKTEIVKPVIPGVKPEVKKEKIEVTPIPEGKEITGKEAEVKATEDFQERVIAGQNIIDEIKSVGREKAINPDGTITLYHGTSPENAIKIKKEGLRKQSYLSLTGKETSGHTKQYDKAEIIEVNVDARDVEFSTGTQEFYAPDGLILDEDKIWKSFERKKVGTEAKIEPGFMRRKTAAAPGATKASDLQSLVDGITSKWDNAPKVEIVQSQSELPKEILKYSHAGSVVDGVYFKGNVYIVADNQASPEAAVKTLLHESFGHFGLRSVLGKEFGDIMDKVYSAKTPEIQTVADNYGFDTGTYKGRALAAEEWLSREAVSNPESTWVSQVVAAIRKFMRKIMPSLKMADAEIRQLIQDARSYVEIGLPGVRVGISKALRDPGYQAIKQAERFYSQVIKTVEDKMPAKMQASAVMNWLKKQPGIKPAEFEWMNIEELLEGKKIVGRDELVGLLKENEVKVEEIVKGIGFRSPFTEKEENRFEELVNIPGGVWSEETQDYVEARDRTAVEEKEYQKLRKKHQKAVDKASKPKFVEYQLPGEKENYRELLFTLPVEGGKIHFKSLEEVQNKRKEYNLPNIESMRFYQEADEALLARINEKVGMEPERDLSKSVFKSEHWPEDPNVFAHVRTNERTDAEGNKVLFVEEIQSDWEQAIRKGERVPDMPFKKNWHEVVLKRIVRMASEQGIDKVSWMTGKQTADRYDLSKQVDSIRVVKRTSGYEFYAKKDGENLISKQKLNEKELAENIGKGLAEKAIGDLEGQGGQATQTYSGLDLKIGANWAYALYDRMIPQYLKKFGKKYGSTVSTIRISDDSKKMHKGKELSDTIIINSDNFADLNMSFPFLEQSDGKLSIKLVSGLLKPSGMQSGGANANLLSDFLDWHASSDKIFSKLPVPMQTVVMDRVRAMLHDAKIGKAIVRSIPVDVMDNFVGEEITTEMLLHNPSMLANSFVSDANANIPAAVIEALDAIVTPSTFPITEVVFGSSDFRGWPVDFRPTKNTSSFHGYSPNEVVETLKSISQSAQVGQGQTQPSFTITPALKKAALYEGMPLFAKRKPPTDYKELLKKYKAPVKAPIEKPLPADEDIIKIYKEKHIAFEPKKLQLNKQTAKDFIAKVYTKFVFAEFPAIRLAAKAKDPKVTQRIQDQINKVWGKGGIVEVFVTGKGPHRYDEGGKPEYIEGSQSLKEIVKDLSPQEYEDYETLRIAERDIALATFRPDIKGTDIETSTQVVKALEGKYGDKIKKLRNVSKEQRKYDDTLLKLLVEEGWLSKKVYEGIKAKPESEFYASFLREMDTVGEQVHGGKDPLKRIKGSELRKIPTIESSVSNTYKTIKLLETIKLNKKIVDLKDLTPDLAEVIEEVQPQYLTKDMPKRPGPRGGTKVSIRSPIQPRGTIIVPVNGVKHYWRVPPDVHKAIDYYSPQEMSMAIKILSGPARLLRAGATLTAEFIMRNPVRDQFTAMVYSKYGYIPFIDFGKGFFELMKKGDLYQEFKAGGGEQSYFTSMDRTTLNMTARDIVGFKKGLKTYNPIEYLRIASEAMEKATRLGVFKRARDKGATTSEATAAARESTLDFRRIGEERRINQIIAFWNANVQGTDILRRKLQKHPGQTLLRLTLGITLPSIALWLFNNSDDERKERYNALPGWRKNFFWNIVLDEGTPIISLPKPFELGLIFGSLPERILDYISLNDPKELKGIATAMKEGALPGIIPTAALPIIENMTNWSFFMKRPIESETIKRLPPGQRAHQYTSSVLREVGKATDLSPVKLENWVRGWSGGLGKLGLDIIDPLFETGDVPEVTKHWYEVTPGIRGFIPKEPIGGAGRDITTFYDNLEEISQAEQGFKVLIKTDRDEAREFDKKTKGVKIFAKSFRKQSLALGKLRKRKAVIMGSKTLLSDRKREFIDTVDSRMTLIAKTQNERFKRFLVGD